MTSRIEKEGQTSRIWVETGDVRTFATIAMFARQGKIVERRWPAVLFRDNVIDLVRKRENVGHVAVFAPKSRPDRDRIEESFIHGCAFVAVLAEAHSRSAELATERSPKSSLLARGFGVRSPPRPKASSIGFAATSRTCEPGLFRISRSQENAGPAPAASDAPDRKRASRRCRTRSPMDRPSIGRPCTPPQKNRNLGCKSITTLVA